MTDKLTVSAVARPEGEFLRVIILTVPITTAIYNTHLNAVLADIEL